MRGAITNLSASLIAIAVHCSACTMVSPVFQAGTSFRLTLAYDRHPVEGLRLQVTLDGDPTVRQSVTTDREGFASFHTLRPGSYSLGVDNNVGIPATVGLDVRDLGPVEVTVPLTSLAALPVPSRSLDGSLYPPDGFARPQPPPSVNVHLDLFDSFRHSAKKHGDNFHRRL
jgi:hypothetical protein